jgi:hypothetical protein
MRWPRGGAVGSGAGGAHRDRAELSDYRTAACRRGGARRGSIRRWRPRRRGTSTATAMRWSCRAGRGGRRGAAGGAGGAADRGGAGDAGLPARGADRERRAAGCGDAAALRDARALADLLEDARLNALCLGPGLGLDTRAEGLVAAALASGRAAVLDADALTPAGAAPGAARSAARGLRPDPACGRIRPPRPRPGRGAERRARRGPGLLQGRRHARGRGAAGLHGAAEGPRHGDRRARTAPAGSAPPSARRRRPGWPRRGRATCSRADRGLLARGFAPARGRRDAPGPAPGLRPRLRPRPDRRGPARGAARVLRALSAGVAELADAPDLGSGAARRGGSSPSTRTRGKEEQTNAGHRDPERRPEARLHHHGDGGRTGREGQEKLVEAQPEIEMKGFRKGKVPMAMLKQAVRPAPAGRRDAGRHRRRDEVAFRQDRRPPGAAARRSKMVGGEQHGRKARMSWSR